VQYLVEGMLLAAEKGRGGKIYFLTDGEPVEFRSFVTAMLQTQGVDPGAKSAPF
jgi:nucleoside-diphosphate-sugar epimerase